MTAITLTHLYALLSEKVGKEEAEALTSYVEQKVDREITGISSRVDKTLEEKTSHLATKADLADLRTELKTDLSDLEVRMGTKMDTHFKWLITTFIGLSVAMMGFMLGIVYFVLTYAKS